MCSFFKWVRILPELHKMSAKLVDFCGVVPQELIGAMCWPTAGGGENISTCGCVLSFLEGFKES